MAKDIKATITQNKIVGTFRSQLVVQQINNGDSYYTQSFIDATEVTVNHNMGKRPAVTVIDSGGDEVIGDVSHISNNQLVVRFSANFSGTVYCN